MAARAVQDDSGRGNADIYQIAKNCRTGVEMIEKYDAPHMKTNLDAAASNIVSPKPKQEKETPSDPTLHNPNWKRTCKLPEAALS
jgi:hypothetical protein